MKLRSLFLCDAASAHPDNTFSVLRGGIDQFMVAIPSGKTPKDVPPSKMALVATIDLEIEEMGQRHHLDLFLMDADGKRVIPELKRDFQLPQSREKGKHNMILDMLIQFPHPGDYSFYVKVNGRELGDFPFKVHFRDV